MMGYPSEPPYICTGDRSIAELVTLRYTEGYVKARKMEGHLITDVCTGRHLNWALMVKADKQMYWTPRPTGKFVCGCDCHGIDYSQDKMLGD